MTQQTVAEVTGKDVWHWVKEERRAKATDEVTVEVIDRSDSDAGSAEVVFRIHRNGTELKPVLDPQYVHWPSTG